ncbi:hypothetical protein C8R48DRAFT_678548 [Suillus tomentosus]|nr:hypothetical protein C8R48DRAFT_678548 [Suillus tomentosus]
MESNCDPMLIHGPEACTRLLAASLASGYMRILTKSCKRNYLPLGVKLDIVDISHYQKAQPVLDRHEVAWRANFVLARGVTHGMWTFQDITEHRLRKRKLTNAQSAWKVATVMAFKELSGMEASSELCSRSSTEKVTVLDLWGRGSEKTIVLQHLRVHLRPATVHTPRQIRQIRNKLMLVYLVNGHDVTVRIFRVASLKISVYPSPLCPTINYIQLNFMPIFNVRKASKEQYARDDLLHAHGECVSKCGTSGKKTPKYDKRNHREKEENAKKSKPVLRAHAKVTKNVVGPSGSSMAMQTAITQICERSVPTQSQEYQGLLIGTPAVLPSRPLSSPTGICQPHDHPTSVATCDPPTGLADTNADVFDMLASRMP